MKATIDSLDLPVAKIKFFDKRVDNIIKLIQEGKINKAKLKAENFENILNKKKFKTDAQILLDILNTLLNNLN